MKLATLFGLCSLLILSVSNGALAIVGPTLSVSTEQDYELPSGAPADIYLWNRDYSGEANYSGAYAPYYCTDSSIQQTCTHTNSGSIISMILTERRSGMKHILKIQAYIEGAYYNAANDTVVVCAGHKKLNYDSRLSCFDDNSSIDTNTRLLTAYITQSEMNALPVGGVWEGKLQIQYAGGKPATYTADITLKGKATGKQDIYFPEFNGANPLVQLDLHPTGSVTSNYYAQDVTNLDMCLYDGFNSNSDSMTLSFKDEGKTASFRKGGYFSIYNTATSGTGTTERIDYRVEMFDPHSKSWRTVKNNDPFTLSAGVNGTDQIRPVRLPSITYPVLCAPAPLRLIVDKFHVVSKISGYYKGILTVEFSPSLNSI